MFLQIIFTILFGVTNPYAQKPAVGYNTTTQNSTNASTTQTTNNGDGSGGETKQSPPPKLN